MNCSPYCNISDSRWQAAIDFASDIIYEASGVEREPSEAEIEHALTRLIDLERDAA